MFIRWFALSIALVCALSAQAFAFEAYTFVDEKCESHSGFVTNVDEGVLDLLALDGSSVALDVSTIKSILIFNFVSNPIAKIRLEAPSVRDLREVTVKEGEPFLGWPVRFMDSLVTIYDLRGKIHVYELESILKVRPAKNVGSETATESSVTPTLDLTAAGQSCPKFLTDRGSNATRPTRVLTDEIKVRQFIEDFGRGFRALESFEERTYLYAKPFLYDPDDRFGFSYFPGGHERTPDIPIYFQWSTGKPYRFQSFTVLGVAVNEFSPNSEPFVQIRSDLKAHVFHALFTGNLANMSVGSSVYTTLGLFRAETYKDYGDIESLVSFNYMALLGGDYGPYSVSVGSFFPVVGMRNDIHPRELLSSSLSYAARFMYTKKTFRFRVIGAPIHFDSSSPTQDDMTVQYYEPLPSSFTFSGAFFRVGVDYDFEGFGASVDYLLNRGDYNEVQMGTAGTYSFSKNVVSLRLRQVFERTVALTALVNLTRGDDSSNLGGTPRTLSTSDTKYGGGLEFFF